MNANDRLARELMGWGCDGEWYHDVPSDRSRPIKTVMCVRDWTPESNDAQADQVVREVAKLRFRWVIATDNDGSRTFYTLRLYPPNYEMALYRSGAVTNRNAHIVKAAVKALDSLKPEPHRCKGMPNGQEGAEYAEWRNIGCDWWQYFLDDRMKTAGLFCHKCGHDLNTEEGSDDLHA